MINSSSYLNRHTGDPRLNEIEQRLRKGTFLKGDERPLGRILEDDAMTVAALDMDLETITDMMGRLYEEGKRGLGDPVIIDDRYEVTVREDRGIIASPWGDHFAAPKAVIEAKNLTTGQKLRFSALSLHLLRHYGFFQGVGSPFRTEPRQLLDFFGT
jgi:hypothetical protein